MNIKSSEEIPEDSPSLTKDIELLASGASTVFLGKILGRGLIMISQIVLARFLGPEQFGLYALGMTIIQIISILALFGMHNGVVRFATPYWLENNIKFKSIILQVLLISLFVSGVIGIGIFYFASTISLYFKNPSLTPVIRLFTISLPLLSGLSVASASTRISKKMQFSVLSEEIIHPTINLILIVLFYILGWKLFGAITANIISYFVAFVCTLYFLKLLYPQAMSAAIKYQPIMKSIFLFSLPTTFTGIFTLSINRVDRLFIGFYRPEAEIGIYQAISQSSVIFIVILTAFNAILTPMIVDLFYKNKLTRLEELYKISTKWGLYFSIPAFLVICFAPKDIIYVLYGPEYMSGSISLLILTIAQFINVATGAVGILLIMTGRQNHWFLITSLMLVLDVILNILLTPRYGMIGAAIATGCAVSGLFLLGLFQVKRELGIWPYDRRFIKGMNSTIITILALILLNQFDFPKPAVSLIFTITVSVGVFAGFLLIFGLDLEDMEFVRSIKTRLTRESNKVH